MSQYGFHELAMEGQKRLRNGDRKGAVPLYVAAINKGTQDFSMLSAVHSQLGNCLVSLRMYELAIKNHQVDLDITLHHLEDAAGVAVSWANLGIAYKEKSDFQSAAGCFQQQLGVGTQLQRTDLQLKALANLGHTYELCGFEMIGKSEQAAAELLSKARDTYLLFLRLAENAKDNESIGRACGYLGNLYIETDNPARAVPHYQRRLRIAQQISDRSGQGRAQCNLGNVYRKLRKYEKACTCYYDDIRLCEELNDLHGEAITRGNLASVYQAMGQGETTLAHLHRQKDLLGQLNNTKSLMKCLERIGTVQMAIGKYKAATKTFKELMKAGVSVGNIDITKLATEKLEEAKDSQRKRKEISAADAAVALGSALEEDDISRKGVAKWTIRGTMSRVFGKKLKDSKQKELILQPTRGAISNGNSPEDSPGVTDTARSFSTSQDSVQLRKERKSSSRMIKRLSTMFSKSPHAGRDDLYLPASPSAGAGANEGENSDDDIADDEFGHDDLIHTLEQLEKEASARQEQDFQNFGSNKFGKSRREQVDVARLSSAHLCDSNTIPQNPSTPTCTSTRTTCEGSGEGWDQEDGYIEMTGEQQC